MRFRRKTIFSPNSSANCISNATISSSSVYVTSSSITDKLSSMVGVSREKPIPGGKTDVGDDRGLVFGGNEASILVGVALLNVSLATKIEVLYKYTFELCLFIPVEVEAV